MTIQIHRTILVTSTHKDTALDLIAAIAGEGQRGMFKTTVGSNGVVTHYLSTGLIDTPFAEILPCNDLPGNIEAILHLAQQANFTIDQAGLEDVLENSIITDKSWEETLSIENLEMVFT